MKIKLGYEVESGKQIDIDASHLIATGVTQLAGKTVTLESLSRRSGFKSVVFKTKIGEKGFSEGRVVKPFFKHRSDYEFVKSLIEAYSKEKLFIEKGTLMELCKGSNDLVQIKHKIDDHVSNEKIKGIKHEIYVRLQYYLESLIPQIQNADFSSVLDIKTGINIMDLRNFSEEAQSLIIESVVSEVLKKEKKVIVIIPEAWKFIPQKYGNPCKRVVESFIRQGATNQNYIWIDSQDMAGVDKIPLKQISTWILGYQSERNEVKHTLDQLPPPDKIKPQVKDIMTLGTGFFYYASRSLTTKVYVQPYWLEDEMARKVAMGGIKVESIKKPEVKDIPIVVPKKIVDRPDNVPPLTNDIRRYIDDRIGELTGLIGDVKQIMENHDIDYDKIVQMVLAKIPQSGNVVYEVAPLDKLRKDFLEIAKGKILQDIHGLDPDAKHMLKYLETRGAGVAVNELAIKCFLKPHGANPYNKFVNDTGKNLESVLVAKKQTNGKWLGLLRTRIVDLMQVHDATEQDMDNLYNHILAGLIEIKPEVSA